MSVKALDASALQFDASIRELASSGGSGGGGSFDPTDINSSISDISTRVGVIENDYIVSDDISTFVTQTALDASYNYLDTSVKALDASIRSIINSGGSGGGGGDMSNYATKSDISTFKPIVYIEKDDYDQLVEDEDVDENVMYVITDLASTDDLANLMTVEDLSTYKQQILDDVVADASVAINTIKTNSVNAVNTAKNNANSSINDAKTSAISAINTAATSIPNFVVMTEAEYELIVPNSSTLYFLT